MTKKSSLKLSPITWRSYPLITIVIAILLSGCGVVENILATQTPTYTPVPSVTGTVEGIMVLNDPYLGYIILLELAEQPDVSYLVDLETAIEDGLAEESDGGMQLLVTRGWALSIEYQDEPEASNYLVTHIEILDSE
jgi:hypothetical protein